MLHLTKQQYLFKQSIFISLITLIAIAILVRLGFWQINRAEEKKAKATFIEQQHQKAILNIYSDNDYLLQDTKLIYQNVQLRGYFDPANQFYLDNKKYQGKPGYEVITPFRLENSKHFLLINRGWVAMGENRSELPSIKTPDGRVNLSGRIMKIAPIVYRPGVNKPTDKSGRVWLYLDTEYFSYKSAYSVYPVILLLDKQSNYGFICQWPRFIAKPEIHFAFALQWFSFALFILFAYLWFGVKEVES